MSTQKDLTPLNDCLACGSHKLSLTLDLGEQPLANSYKDSKEEQQETYPLAINHCQDCFHVQLTHAVNPDLMFKNYLYVSGTSKTMKEHFKWFADYTKEVFYMHNRRYLSSVLDIGCNDGSQLDAFKKNGRNEYVEPIATFGVDPAENLGSISSKKGHQISVGYFNSMWVSKNPGVYDILVAQNVFAHNKDPLGFLKAARMAMDDDSLLFVQTSQADMILNGEFDTIYHEHISFYNIQSMYRLCKRLGMYLVDVTKCPLHGNSYIFTIAKHPRHSRPANIHNLIEMERKAGLYSEETYVKYAERANEIAKELKLLLNGLANKGPNGKDYFFVGYGAAAKGMTLLNYTGIELDWIIDDNPMKQDKYTPGSSIHIVSSNKLDVVKKPIVFIPLAWNFFDEIRAKIKEKRDNPRDVFMKYFPEVKVLE